MIEILGVEAGGTRDAERVVRDRDGRRVGSAHERSGALYLDLAADAPATVRSVLDAERERESRSENSQIRLESRFVDDVDDGEIRLRI